jgi:dihydropteroate synthase
MIDMPLIWDLSKIQVMGILNCTPDSFSDGGLYLSLETALSHVDQMVKAGANIIDVGGESTRPGADPVDLDTELARVIPVIQAIHQKYPNLPISIDTTKAEVARQAVLNGAKIINDIHGFKDPQIFDFAVEAHQSHGVALVVMHMRGRSVKTMQTENLEHDHLFEEIKDWLKGQVQALEMAGVDPKSIAIDPGIGFGKTVDQNIEILSRCAELKSLGVAVLIGTSRKSFIGQICNRQKDQRLYGSLATECLVAWEGAHILRVHDVEPTIDAMKIIEQCLKFKAKSNKLF